MDDLELLRQITSARSALLDQLGRPREAAAVRSVTWEHPTGSGKTAALLTSEPDVEVHTDADRIVISMRRPVAE